MITNDRDRIACEVLIDLAVYNAKLRSSASPLALPPVEEFDFSGVQYGDRLIDDDVIAVRGGQKFDRGRFVTVEHMKVRAEKYLNAINYRGVAVQGAGDYIRIDGTCENVVNHFQVSGNGHPIDPFREESTAAMPTQAAKPFYADGTLERMVVNILMQDGGLVALSNVITKVTDSIGRRRDQDKNQKIEDTLMDLWMLGHADRYQGVDGLQYFQMNVTA